jgi:hypothetical protein
LKPKQQSNKQGTGAGIIALKLLGIDLAKVIYVDSDKVARHVYCSNHDMAVYGNSDSGSSIKKKKNDLLDDDDAISHVFDYESFESIDNNLDAFMEKHAREFLLGCSYVFVRSFASCGLAANYY